MCRLKGIASLHVLPCVHHSVDARHGILTQLNDLSVFAPACALLKCRVSTVSAVGDGSANTASHSPLAAPSVGLDEREKELIRMKMERLDAAKTMIDREHALHSGTAGAPGGSSGAGGGGGGRYVTVGIRNRCPQQHACA